MSKRTSFDRRSDPPLPLVEIPKQSRELLFQTFLKLHVSSMEPNRLNVKVISFQALSNPRLPRVPKAGWANALGFNQLTHGATLTQAKPWVAELGSCCTWLARCSENPLSAWSRPDRTVRGAPEEKR